MDVVAGVGRSKFGESGCKFQIVCLPQSRDLEQVLECEMGIVVLERRMTLILVSSVHLM